MASKQTSNNDHKENSYYAYGDNSPEIVKLQSKLVAMGYTITKLDGIYGPETKEAVKRFQSKNGLAQDGIAGTETLIKINNILNGIKFGSILQPANNQLGLLSSDIRRREGVLSEETYMEAGFCSPDLGLIASSIEKKGENNHAELSTICQTYKNNVGAIMKNIFSTIVSFIDANSEMLEGRAGNVQIRVNQLRNRLLLSVQAKDRNLLEAKKNLAKLQDIKLNLNAIKKNALYRRFLGYAPVTNESERVLASALKNQWNKAQQSVIKVLRSQRFKTRIEENIARQTKNVDTLIARAKKWKVTGGFLKFLLNWGELIWMLIRYEDSTEWNNKMERIINELTDNLIVELIVALIGVVLAVLAIEGIITVALAGTLTIIIGLVVSIIGGLILWILEDNDIYPSVYLQDLGNEMTYKLLYR